MSQPSTTDANPTASVLVIGNEILSGRTQDANINFLAQRLGALGITLREVRVIPDDHDFIVATITDLRARYDHLFTTGGIGPTHDDITSECVAQAMGVPWEIHPETFALLEAYFTRERFNAARQRMAMLPRGAVPIRNPVSLAPGYSIGNVHVMAGVPAIMRAMFDELAPGLRGGRPVVSCSWYAFDLFEGGLAAGFAAIARDYPALDLGSYPFHRPDGRHGVALVAKGLDRSALAGASDAIRALIVALGATPQEGEPPA
ncbi:competence-damage protein [Ameyamaea chiangmaiensis NBRC 103196]|uniref:Competence/damage-inducible protein A n=1 Tax=Ameyamaea chiangmaiensis TaxID=442969 RepID=A0A850PBU3_9PROT|nr:molybdopterin-binding protein [Ameyamaea chiangmaiensis]MBS4074032.1 competence/damage-inducible protein A [Ameyamaea chiangmaiensis]NVN39412.1 competence/damage-inducible protein A [Ameyamaea chiangmaiensis]GBQ67508.1 competence-damage protein [Ameyamaea chiangmaiensis NBRC 103196]